MYVLIWKLICIYYFKGDASLAQIVNDIQHTLCRLSPDGVLESPSRDTLSTVKNMIGDSEYNNFVRKDCSHKVKSKLLSLKLHFF